MHTTYDGNYDKLVELVEPLKEYYDIDKIKPWGVFVWNKSEGTDFDFENDENLFDILADKIIFYGNNNENAIIEETKPIIEKIQEQLKIMGSDVQ